MIRILDKGILFGLGAVLLFQRQEFVIPVVVLLTALIFSSFSLYLTDAKILGILWMGYLVLCVIRPEFSYFLPLYHRSARDKSPRAGIFCRDGGGEEFSP